MKEKMTFRQRVENFWYYYRHPVIVAAFFVPVIIFFLKDVVFQERYDMKMMLVTYGVTLTAEEEDALRENIEQYVPDLDGNGKSRVKLTWIGLIDPDSPEGDPQAVYAMQTKLTGELSDLDNVILIFEESLEAGMELPEACVNLEQTYPDAPGLREYALPLKETTLTQGEELAALPDTLCIYLRQNMFGEFSKEKAEFYEQQVQVLENILYDQKVN